MKNNLKDKLNYHLTISTGSLAEVTPVFAAYETTIAGMTNDISMHARLIVAGFTYFAGAGFVFSKGRDIYRKKFNITHKSKEKVQILNDALYAGLFNLTFNPMLYYASGSRDLEEIVLGTLGSVSLGLVNGAPVGYSLDMFKDLMGIKECERPSYPKFLKNRSSKAKKSIAGLLTLGSLGLTAGIYALNK